MTQAERTAAIEAVQQTVADIPFENWPTQDLKGVIGTMLEAMAFDYQSSQRTAALIQAQCLLSAEVAKAYEREQKQLNGAVQRALYQATGKLKQEDEITPIADLESITAKGGKS